MNKIIWSVIILIFIAVFFFIGYSSNSSSDEVSIENLQNQISVLQQENVQLKSQVDNSNKGTDECVLHLMNYYEKQQGVISTETGKIAIGFIENDKNALIDLIEGYGISMLSDQGTFSYFDVPVGEEIKWICTFMNDDQIKDKIEWIEPDVLISGNSN